MDLSGIRSIEGTGLQFSAYCGIAQRRIPFLPFWEVRKPGWVPVVRKTTLVLYRKVGGAFGCRDHWARVDYGPGTWWLLLPEHRAELVRQGLLFPGEGV